MRADDRHPPVHEHHLCVQDLRRVRGADRDPGPEEERHAFGILGEPAGDGKDAVHEDAALYAPRPCLTQPPDEREGLGSRGPPPDGDPVARHAYRLPRLREEAADRGAVVATDYGPDAHRSGYALNAFANAVTFDESHVAGSVSASAIPRMNAPRAATNRASPGVSSGTSA